MFVAVVTLTTLRRLLLRCESTDNVLDTINNVRVQKITILFNKTQDICIYFLKFHDFVLDNRRNVRNDSQ